MVTIIALVMQVLIGLITPQHADVIVIPPMPNYAPEVDHAIAYDQGCMCEDCYYQECYEDALSEFDALFNSYTYKRTRNGRSMINGKFVAMGAK